MAQTELKFNFDPIRFILGLAAVALIYEAVILTGGKVEAERHLALAGAAALLAIAAAWTAVRRAAPEARMGVATNLSIVMIVVAVVTGIIQPVLQGARAVRQGSLRVMCMSNEKQLVVGLLAYAGDHDERLPPSSGWRTASQDPLDPEKQCPSATTPWSYSMNASLSGIDCTQVENASDLVTIFEADAQTPDSTGGQESFVARHSGRGTVSFLAGQTKRIAPGNGDWKPQITSSQKQ